jgi:hypothetical protein
MVLTGGEVGNTDVLKHVRVGFDSPSKSDKKQRYTGSNLQLGHGFKFAWFLGLNFK